MVRSRGPRPRRAWGQRGSRSGARFARRSLGRRTGSTARLRRHRWQRSSQPGAWLGGATLRTLSAPPQRGQARLPPERTPMVLSSAASAGENGT